MALALANISKRYEKVVLDNFSADFPPGITAIMGPSGAGKTTLANIIAGLVQPDAGEVRGTAGLKFSFVFQEDRLLPHETALTNVNFPLKKNSDKSAELLRAAGLADAMHVRAQDLSGGMRRRVAICRALAVEYDVIIFDEPMKGFAGEIKEKMLRLITEKTRGKTVIYITHDETEAQLLAARVVYV